MREALAALKRKGLVQINNGERARVSRPSADTIIGELSGMAKDFFLILVGLPISNNYVCSLNPAWCAMRLNMPPMSNRLLAKALEINSQSLDNNAAFIRSDVDFPPRAGGDPR